MSTPPAAPSPPPWRTEGLFSTHYLLRRLAAPAPMPRVAGDGGATGAAAASGAVFERALDLYRRNRVGLRKGNEEDCEKRFVSPLLEALGFGIANRKQTPGIDQRLLPDYLLYGSADAAEAAFQAGAREAYYADAVGILEAKRWGHNLSEDASGRSPHHQIRDYLSESDRLVWGVLTNGGLWRLYCKRDRVSAFFEFDLEAVLALADADEAAARAWFGWFHALFARDAFARRADGSCALDAVRDGALSFRAEVERDLRRQVFDCVELLGQGFLDNAENGLAPRDLPAIFANSLILLYRVLFVLNAEARGLLPTPPENERESTISTSSARLGTSASCPTSTRSPRSVAPSGARLSLRVRSLRRPPPICCVSGTVCRRRTSSARSPHTSSPIRTWIGCSLRPQP